MLHRLLAPLVASIMLMGVAFAPSTTAATAAERREDPKAERERVRTRQAEVASQIDVLEADQAKVEEALALLNEHVAAQEGLLTDATAAANDAERRLGKAEEAVDEAKEDLAELRKQVTEFAVDAYMMPDGEQLDSVLGADNLSDAARRDALLDHRAGDDADLTDRLRATQDELEARQAQAAAAKEEAEAAVEEAEDRVLKVKAARDQQADFEERLWERIDANIAESIELAETDKALSFQIALEQLALEARLAEQRERERLAAEARERQRLAAEALERKRLAEELLAARDSQALAHWQEAIRQLDAQSSAALPGVSYSSSSGLSLAQVDGITVNVLIAESLQAMLYAAKADGVVLTGGGYRNAADQIALRKAHCGTSPYAIYEMPASQCTPPTAPPGLSMHEIGLAVDFENCGTRDTACYKWLAANAEAFGFYNLPSEPWHWSINGN